MIGRGSACSSAPPPGSELVSAAQRRPGPRRELHRLDARAVQHALAVEEQHEHGGVGRGLVQLLHRGQASLPELIRRPPADHPHPLPSGSATRLLADHCQSALERVHSVPSQLVVVESALPDGVGVRVVEPGDHRVAPGVDDPGVLPPMGRDLHVGADGRELVAFHGERGRLRAPCIHRDDLGVHHDQIGGRWRRHRRLLRRRGRARRHGGDQGGDQGADHGEQERSRHGSRRARDGHRDAACCRGAAGRAAVRARW